MLPPQHRLSNFKEFSEVARHGRKYFGPHFRVSIKVLQKPTPTKVGFVVSKKVARKAASRNLLKRRMRETVRREIFPTLPRNTYIVISALSGSVNLTYNDITYEMQSIFSKVK